MQSLHYRRSVQELYSNVMLPSPTWVSQSKKTAFTVQQKSTEEGEASPIVTWSLRINMIDLGQLWSMESVSLQNVVRH